MKSFPCKVLTAAALLLIVFAPCNALGARVERIPASDLVIIVIIVSEWWQPNLVEQLVWRWCWTFGKVSCNCGKLRLAAVNLRKESATRWGIGSTHCALVNNYCELYSINFDW